MANFSSNVDQLPVDSADKEAFINALFDALSPSMLGGRRAFTCAGLVWGYYGGNVLNGSTITQIGNGTITLPASSTSYIELTASTGLVSNNTTGFTAGRLPLYTVVTNASAVISWTDVRPWGPGVGGAGGGSVGGSDTQILFNDAGVVAGDTALLWDKTNNILTIQGSILAGLASLALNATAGFPYISACAGVPTGVPTAQTGRVPLVADSTNNAIRFFANGFWQSANGLSIRTASGTTDTPTLADAENAIKYTNGSPVTVTIPPNSAQPFRVGAAISFIRYGAGTVTLAPGSGVSFVNGLAALTVRTQYSIASAMKLATDEWLLLGDLG